MWSFSNSFAYPPTNIGFLNPGVTSWLRLPKLILGIHVIQWQQKQTRTGGSRTLGGTLMNMLPPLFFLLHLCACFWWMCGSYSFWSESEAAYAGECPHS